MCQPGLSLIFLRQRHPGLDAKHVRAVVRVFEAFDG